MENVEVSENVIIEQTRREPLFISFDGEDFLNIAAKWAQFLAVVMFVGIGLMVAFSILFIAMGSTLSQYQDFSGMPMGALGGLYLILSIVYFFPSFFLYRFATGVKTAFKERSEAALTKSFEFLKNYHLFIGVVMIIGLVFMVIAIIAMIFFMGSLAMFSGF